MNAMDDLMNAPATPSTLDEALDVAQLAERMNLRYTPLHRALHALAAGVRDLRDERDQALIRAETAENELAAYRAQDESAAIVHSGQCRCTEDEACWDHEALELRAENMTGRAE